MTSRLDECLTTGRSVASLRGLPLWSPFYLGANWHRGARSKWEAVSPTSLRSTWPTSCGARLRPVDLYFNRQRLKAPPALESGLLQAPLAGVALGSVDSNLDIWAAKPLGTAMASEVVTDVLTAVTYRRFKRPKVNGWDDDPDGELETPAPVDADEMAVRVVQ